MASAERVIAYATSIPCVGAGVLHLSAAGDHTNLPVMAVGFVLVAIAQVGVGVYLILRPPSRPALLGAMTLMAGALGTWILSRTAGLPFLPNGHAEPIGFKDGVTVLFEVGALPGFALLMSPRLADVPLPGPQLGRQVVTGFSVFAFALMIPGFVLGGGEHHSHEEAVAMGIHEDGHGHGEEAGASSTHGDEGHHGTESAESVHHANENQHDGGRDHHGGERASASSASGGHGHSDSVAAITEGSEGHGHGGPSRGREGGGAGGHSQAHQRSGEGGSGSGDSNHGHPGSPDRDDEGSGSAGEDEHAGGGHEEHPPDGGEDGGDKGGDTPATSALLRYTPPDSGDADTPARGGQLEIGPRQPNAEDGHAHHTDRECKPTEEQRAAADDLYRRTRAALRKYDNNPARALADGYELAWHGGAVPPRYIHVFNAQHVYDSAQVVPQPTGLEPPSEPVILDPNRLESFMYAMTDEGLIAIGGMYMMPATYNEAKGDFLLPRAPFEGPKLGGCLTRWHDHKDLGRMTNRSGAPTPQMLHVWTYPGLEPFSEYTGPEIATLWGIGNAVPTIRATVGPGTFFGGGDGGGGSGGGPESP